MYDRRQIDLALDIARRSGEILLSYFDPERMQARAKGPRDVVTEADLAAERFAAERLRERFPGDGVVGEEGAEIAARGSRRWFLDPLDGTMNYSRGIPFWCVSLALFEGKRPVFGVIHDPIRDETFDAALGSGARCNGRPIRCSEERDMENAVVHLTVDFNDQSKLEGLEDLQILAPRVLRTRNMGSAALALAYVAAGRFDAMVHRFAHTWDFAAGAILVQEAGGVISDLAGDPFTDRTTSILAAGSRELHAALLDLFRLPRDARVE